MASKNKIFPFMNRKFLFLSIFLYLVKTESNLSLKEIEKVCSNSDEYITYFFNGDEELPKKYNILDQTEIQKGNDEYIIRLILLSKNAEKKYEKAKTSHIKIYKILLIILMIFFCIIIIISEIHFLCKIFFEDIDKTKKKENTITCPIFSKINPISFFTYPFMNQKERDKDFSEYKSEKTLFNKRQVIFISIIIFILMIGSIILAIFNCFQNNKTKKSVDNMTCTLMKFLYEMKNKPIRQSSFLGYENVNNLINDSEKVKKENEKLTNKSNELKTQNTNWNLSINEFQKKLSNQESMEFYFYGLPSDPKNMNFKDFSLMGDISKANKHLYQLQVIYNYYPVNTKEKILYDINKFFYDLSEPIINEVEKLEKKINQQDTDSKENENNDIYKNVVSKLVNVLNLYIKKFKEVYMEKINKNLKSDLTKIYIFDYILLLLLVLCIPISIILIKNVFKKNSSPFNKISALLMNCIFMLFILTTYQLIIIQNINKKMTYIQDIWRGIAFLFDSTNINYLNKISIKNVSNIDILINEDSKYNNLFYYLNYMINNDGKLSEDSMTQISLFTNEELLTASKKFNNLSNYLDSCNVDNPNEYLYNYIQKISDMKKEGLKYDTKFRDILGTGYMDFYYEDPLTYLTYVNLRTRTNYRHSWGFKDFNCNETWNISTENYSNWLYINSKEYLCDYCLNHCSANDSEITPLLNFAEFTLEQAIERYSDLKNTEFNAEYNGLVYYFTAAEFLRNSSFMEHLQKIYDFNIKLSEIQNVNFNLLKKIVNSSKEVINGYFNILNFTGDGGNISSSLYCDFLREDLNFVLGEIKDNFLTKINNLKVFHILMNILNIVLSVYMIILYCLISYDLSFYLIENGEAQKIKQENESSIKKIINDKKIVKSLFSNYKTDKNNHSNTKEGYHRPIIITINGNTMNNFSKKEGETGNKNENNNSNLQINDKIKLNDIFLRNKDDIKYSMNKIERLYDVEEIDFPSKANIIGDLQNNDGILNLNESKK